MPTPRAPFTALPSQNPHGRLDGHARSVGAAAAATWEGRP